MHLLFGMSPTFHHGRQAICDGHAPMVNKRWRYTSSNRCRTVCWGLSENHLIFVKHLPIMHLYSLHRIRCPVTHNLQTGNTTSASDAAARAVSTEMLFSWGGGGQTKMSWPSLLVPLINLGIKGAAPL